MDARKLLLSLLVILGVVALPATAAHALQVKVSINFGSTIIGPDNGTLVVTANPGDLLRITWALGTDTDILRYHGLISGVDTSELTRDVGSALELTGQGFDPCCNPNAPDTEQFYDAASDGAPTGFAANDGELWRIEYFVTNPITDTTADMTYTFNESGFPCFSDSGGFCPGAPGSASLRVDAVPEPGTFLLLGLGLAGISIFSPSKAKQRNADRLAAWSDIG